MKTRTFLFGILALVLAALACQAPNYISDGEETPESADNTASVPDGMPYVELDYDKMFETLSSGGASSFESFAVEEYDDEDFAGPGEFTFTSTIPASQNIFWNYGWCAIDEDTLVDNFEHIQLTFYFNGKRLSGDLTHAVGNTRDDNWQCGIVGILLSDWEPGNYQFVLVATFDTKINDGGADFDAGDYVFKYDVTVE